MASWQIWLIIAGICFVIEIATVGFLVFWFAIAALITCILSLFIKNIIAQFVIFIILSILLLFLTKPFAKKITKCDNTTTNINRIIGKTGIGTKSIESNKCGQVKVESDIWTAISNIDIPAGSNVQIDKVDGVKLVVSPTQK